MHGLSCFLLMVLLSFSMGGTARALGYGGSRSWLMSPDSVKRILTLPLDNRNQVLRQHKTYSFEILKYLVLSDKEGMQVRWHALMSLASVYPERSRAIVRQALQHSVWFMRNAGLLAMEIIDPTLSMQWADSLLDDPSLIVRTAAVDLIKKRGDRRYKLRLLAKLNASDSFYRNESLWIRYHIMSALADFAELGDEKFFALALQDGDPRLHIPAMVALSKITGKTFQSDSVKTRRQKWINWWLQFNKDSADHSLSSLVL